MDGVGGCRGLGLETASVVEDILEDMKKLTRQFGDEKGARSNSEEQGRGEEGRALAKLIVKKMDHLQNFLIKLDDLLNPVDDNDEDCSFQRLRQLYLESTRCGGSGGSGAGCGREAAAAKCVLHADDREGFHFPPRAVRRNKSSVGVQVKKIDNHDDEIRDDNLTTERKSSPPKVKQRSRSISLRSGNAAPLNSACSASPSSISAAKAKALSTTSLNAAERVSLSVAGYSNELLRPSSAAEMAPASSSAELAAGSSAAEISAASSAYSSSMQVPSSSASSTKNRFSYSTPQTAAPTPPLRSLKNTSSTPAFTSPLSFSPTLLPKSPLTISPISSERSPLTISPTPLQSPSTLSPTTSILSPSTSSPTPSLKSPTTSSPSPSEVWPNFGSLPTEILTHVFGFLTTRDLGAASSVCSKWRRIAGHHSLWHSITLQPSSLDRATLAQILSTRPSVRSVTFHRRVPLTLESAAQLTRHATRVEAIDFAVRDDVDEVFGILTASLKDLKSISCFYLPTSIATSSARPLSSSSPRAIWGFGTAPSSPGMPRRLQPSMTVGGVCNSIRLSKEIRRFRFHADAPIPTGFANEAETECDHILIALIAKHKNSLREIDFKLSIFKLYSHAISRQESRLTLVGVRGLPECRRLTRLMLQDCHLTDAAVSILRDLWHLRALGLLNVEGLTRSSWGRLFETAPPKRPAAFPRLVEVDLQSSVGDAAFDALLRLRAAALQDFRIEVCKSDPFGSFAEREKAGVSRRTVVEVLSRCPNLKKFELCLSNNSLKQTHALRRSFRFDNQELRRLKAPLEVLNLRYHDVYEGLFASIGSVFGDTLRSLTIVGNLTDVPIGRSIPLSFHGLGFSVLQSIHLQDIPQQFCIGLDDQFRVPVDFPIREVTLMNVRCERRSLIRNPVQEFLESVFEGAAVRLQKIDVEAFQDQVGKFVVGNKCL